MNDTAKTGFIIKATNNEAPKVIMSVIGRFFINLPITPGQNNNGKKGASVVRVTATTGKNTSPAANFAPIH